MCHLGLKRGVRLRPEILRIVQSRVVQHDILMACFVDDRLAGGISNDSGAALCTAPSYEQLVISDGYLQPEQPDLTG